jgi:hypothetical protein
VTDRAGETEPLARLFRIFAATQCRGRSAVYERLGERIGADDALLHLLLTAPAQQRRPSLLFAAVNALLAADPDAELAAYYPTHGGTRSPDAGLWPAFRAFCAGHADELGRLLREGSTQTNEIRRCVALRLGLGQVHRRWPGPVALAEIGASAGLNLLFDRYDYRLGDRRPAPVPRYSSSEFSGGSDASAVEIGCEVRGAGPGDRVLGAAPEITSRLGVDQQPVDLADPAARAWLEAYAVGVSLREPGGRRDDALLGLADPYLRWLAPARDADDDFGWVRDDAA